MYIFKGTNSIRTIREDLQKDLGMEEGEIYSRHKISTGRGTRLWENWGWLGQGLRVSMFHKHVAGDKELWEGRE